MTILHPLLAMLLLTMVVWLVMLVSRIRFFAANPDVLSAEEQSNPVKVRGVLPPSAWAPADNFRNLFEVPVLFYAVVLALLATNMADQMYVLLAWVFVVFRVLHSVIHCSYNKVTHRFLAYAIAALALWVMLVCMAVQLLSAG